MKSKIMFGVYLIYFMRKLKSPFFVESFAFAVIGVCLFYLVSIPSVLTNMRASNDFYGYFMTAFFGTDFLVQSTLVLAAVTTLFLVKNITVHTVLKERFT